MLHLYTTNPPASLLIVLISGPLTRKTVFPVRINVHANSLKFSLIRIPSRLLKEMCLEIIFT